MKEAARMLNRNSSYRIRNSEEERYIPEEKKFTYEINVEHDEEGTNTYVCLRFICRQIITCS